MCEKQLEKYKNLYMGFMDLEKEYDGAKRDALHKYLQIFSLQGKLL